MAHSDRFGSHDELLPAKREHLSPDQPGKSRNAYNRQCDQYAAATWPQREGDS